MIDVAPDKRVIKLSVTVDDDINLILDAIAKVEGAFVMLVIPEGNDLLNSPIGLKALRKKTFEKEKRLILVVPQGPSFELVKNAGFMVTTAQESVNGSLWQQAMDQYDEYHHANVGMNSKKPQGKKLDKGVEYLAPLPEDNLPVPEIISSNTVIAAEEAIEQKREERVIPQSEDQKQNITGIDFSKMVRQGKSSSFFSKKPTSSPMAVNTAITPQELNTFHPDIMPKTPGKPVAKISKKRDANPVMNLVVMGLIGLVLIGISIFVAYYLYFPRIRVEMQVKSSALTVSDKVLATSAVTGFDLNKKEIQLTKESEDKNGSLSFTATEAGADGTKATGTVYLDNSDSADKTIPSGTLILSGSLKFATQSSVTVPGKSGGALGHGSVNVQASDLGEEYNLPAGSSFTVQGFSTITGGSTAAFSGGTKRVFVVLGQKDVDKVTKDLQAQLKQEAVSDLMYMDQDQGYTFISESVKTVVKGKPTIVPAVGSEVKPDDQEPNITLFITTSALYYHKESLTKLAERMLIAKYQADNSLSEAEAANTVIDQLAVNVTKVTVDKDEKVTVEFTATGLATARIDVDQVRTSIAGKKWPDMLSYIQSVPTLNGAPTVKFFPSWLPDFMKYVPKEAGRIDVSVVVVKPTAAVSQ